MNTLNTIMRTRIFSSIKEKPTLNSIKNMMSTVALLGSCSPIQNMTHQLEPSKGLLTSKRILSKSTISSILRYVWLSTKTIAKQMSFKKHFLRGLRMMKKKNKGLLQRENKSYCVKVNSYACKSIQIKNVSYSLELIFSTSPSEIWCANISKTGRSQRAI